MGRICPILNHPLVDGVFVEEEAIVNFIQKRNVDFLPTELVCRSCKREVTKLYFKKLNKAILLHKLRRNASVSSLGTSSATTVSEVQLGENLQLAQSEGRLSDNSSSLINQLNNGKLSSNVHSPRRKIANISASSVSETPIIISSSNKQYILQENRNNKTVKSSTISAKAGNQPNVTIRKKTIKDYLTAKTTQQNGQTNGLSKTTTSDKTADDDDVIRRLSEEPTTSRAATRNLPTILETSDTSDGDDTPLILHAIRGTRLPNIQPIPPRRQPPDESNSLARDIMDEYIRDIHGG